MPGTARRGALVNIHVEQVFAVEEDFPVGDFVAGVAGQGVCEGGFPGTVGAMMAWISPDLMVRSTPFRSWVSVGLSSLGMTWA